MTNRVDYSADDRRTDHQSERVAREDHPSPDLRYSLLLENGWQEGTSEPVHGPRQRRDSNNEHG